MEETYSVLYYVLETAEEKTVYLWIGAYRVSSVTPDCPALFLKAKKNSDLICVLATGVGTKGNKTGKGGPLAKLSQLGVGGGSVHAHCFL